MTSYIALDIAEVTRQIDRLIADYPELLEDEALREDMISGSTNLDQVVSRALDHALEAEAMAEAIKARMGFMGDRKARYDRRAEAMRSLILGVMKSANLPKIALPEASISISAGRDSVVITDETALPTQLGTTKWSPDKKAIAEQIKAGVDVPGADIQTGPE